MKTRKVTILKESDLKRIVMEVVEDLNNVKVGISVNDGYGTKFTDLILKGEKTIETRNRRTLEPFVGEWVGLIRTGVGKATLVGYILLGEPVRYDTKEDFDKDYDKHHVRGDNGKLSMKGRKFGYPIVGVKPIEPVPLDIYKPISKFTKDNGEVLNVARYVAREL